MIYLDNAATTRPCDEVIKKANEMMSNTWANPSSLYSLGMYAEDEIESSREKVAQLIGAKPKNVVFTSGGTESNNLAIFSALKSTRHVGKRIVASAYEHSSVIEPLKNLEKEGYEVEFVCPQSDGTISLKTLENALTPDTALVCIMLTNNEVGAVNDIKSMASLTKKVSPKAHFHCDCVAALGKIKFSAELLGVDSLSVSSHKINGLKGTGAVYFKNNLKPLIVGGEQERKLRGGTQNAVGIAAFGVACEIAQRDFHKHLTHAKELKEHILKWVDSLDFVKINSKNDFEYITNVSVSKIKSETMLHFLESREIYISSGSACSKGQKSHVLKSLNLSDDDIDSALRISISHDNTKSDIDRLFEEIKNAHKKLIKR